MSAADLNKTNKNCLLVLKNKKINDFDAVNSLIGSFGDCGYYFEKVVFCAFDNSSEIAQALQDGVSNYGNTVIYCPAAMEKAVKDFISKQTGAEFDLLNILKSEQNNVFILFADRANKLTVNEICNLLNKQYGKSYEKAFIKTVGAPASAINKAVDTAKSFCGNIDINISATYGDCTVKFVYDSTTPKSAFDKAYRSAVEILQNYVYALDDVSLAERLVQLLKLRRMKICVAESFTGGGVGKRLVDISGVSEVYFEGLNTYSNESKAQRLGVDEMTLKRFGAVSEQTAAEMAEGLINGGNCDVSVATTGIAGPNSDNTKKPVGLAFIAVGLKDGTAVYKYELKGSRKSITETAVNEALFLAYKSIK